MTGTSVNDSTHPSDESPVGEVRLAIGERECSILYRRALVSWVDEQRYLGEDEARKYGLVLWPSSIALALEISARADEFRGRSVLELGAGVGLPGIVAAASGAEVVQTDRDEDALALCRRNAERNGVGVECRLADWSEWTSVERYDWVIASDVLYRSSLHGPLRSVLESSVTAGGRLLLSDPLRSASMPLLESLERDGWTVRMSRWAVGEGEFRSAVGVFEVHQ